MKENNEYIYESNDDLDKNLNIDKAINKQNYINNLNQNQDQDQEKKIKTKINYYPKRKKI